MISASFMLILPQIIEDRNRSQALGNIIFHSCFNCIKFLFYHPFAFGLFLRGKPNHPDINNFHFPNGPEVNLNSCDEVGSQSLAEPSVCFELWTFQFWLQSLNPLSHSPNGLHLKRYIYHLCSLQHFKLCSTRDCN